MGWAIGKHGGWSRVSAGFVLPCVLLAAASAWAQSLEYPVKANYLVRFAAFVDWPAQAYGAASAPMVICVVGADPFGSALTNATSGQTAHGRPVVARRMATISAESGCHIAYFGQGSTGPTEALERAGVLTVTDTGAARRGALHFAVVDNRVRFHVDQAAATRGGLSINSRLLALAVSVTGGR